MIKDSDQCSVNVNDDTGRSPNHVISSLSIVDVGESMKLVRTVLVYVVLK